MVIEVIDKETREVKNRMHKNFAEYSEWLEANKGILKQKMENFRTELFAGAPDDIGIRHAFGDIVGDGIKFGFR